MPPNFAVGVDVALFVIQMTRVVVVESRGLREAGHATRRRCRWLLLLRASIASIMLVSCTGAVQAGQSPTSVRTRINAAKDKCLTRSEELLATRAVFVDKEKRSAPVGRIDSIPPPEIEWRKGTAVRRNALLGVILLKSDGNVADVWLVSGFAFNPPWPEFTEAYLNYLRNWKYEMPDASPPVCMEVAINVDFS